MLINEFWKCCSPLYKQMFFVYFIIFFFFKDSFLKTGSTQTEDDLLEGHLCLTRELISYLGLTKKYEIGSDPSKSVNLIKVNLKHWVIFNISKNVVTLFFPLGTS